jgi:phosphoribosylanthranilate isomerase
MAPASDIKFCGLTRAEDVAFAAELGAAYIGVILAGGLRRLTVEEAKVVLANAPGGVKRVGVFADQSVPEIQQAVEALELDVVQLHADPTGDQAARVREATEAKVWPVVRLTGTEIPDSIDELSGAADALLVDAKVAGMLGGSGVALPWRELAGALAPHRRCPLVLAGGLRPENVGEAIAALRPAVVDVSSGVESTPGIKDHERMRAFRDAVVRANQQRNEAS